MKRWRIVAGVVGIGGLLVGAMVAGSGPSAGPAGTGPGRAEGAARSGREAAPDDWVVSQRVAFSGVPRGAPARAAAHAPAPAPPPNQPSRSKPLRKARAS